MQGINTILSRELGLERVFTYKNNSSLPNVIGIIHNDYEGQLNTGKLYRTIYRYAQNLGINLLGGLEVLNWESDTEITITTRQQINLKTKNLILCTNAFTPNLVDEDISPCRGQVIVSEQIDQLPIEGLPANSHDRQLHMERHFYQDLVKKPQSPTSSTAGRTTLFEKV